MQESWENYTEAFIIQMKKGILMTIQSPSKTFCTTLQSIHHTSLIDIRIGNYCLPFTSNRLIQRKTCVCTRLLGVTDIQYYNHT